MIGSLSGKLGHQLGDQLLIDVNGVGYLVTVSNRVRQSNRRIGEEISVVVYTDVKENAIALYGFVDQMEREVFLLVKRVKGIGPKHAMSIVSTLGPEALLGAIGRGDIDRLKNVPGIGRKTAERLIMELREFVGELAFESADSEASLGAAVTMEREAESLPQGAIADAVLALEKLGFAKDRARNAVRAAQQGWSGAGEPDSGELLRMSLLHL